jgi:glycosyltransferase involved in cell wall biosynthesis
MEAGEPLISVIVPAYNVAEFLPATLDGVIAQTERRWECVVVDDGSSDDTYAVAAAFARDDSRIRAVRAPHGGTSHARNLGFRNASSASRYVTFMDSDDVWLPHALEALLRPLERDERFIGSHGLAEFIDASGRPLAPGSYSDTGRMRLGLQGRRLVRWPLDRPTSFDVLINGNVLFPPGLLLVRRRAYELAGPFDESLIGPEDWDMLIRLSRFGDLHFIDRVILQYRRHGANQGARPWIPEQAWLVRCIAFHSPENSVEQREIARRGWRAYQLRMAAERLRSAWTALSRGNALDAIKQGARLPVYAWRYVRGYPLPRVNREPLTW